MTVHSCRAANMNVDHLTQETQTCSAGQLVGHEA
jgi:hypothetical protein